MYQDPLIVPFVLSIERTTTTI